MMNSFLIDLFVRSLAVLAGVGLLAFAVRRMSAASRSLVWRVGIGLLLALPVLAAVVPKWTIALLPPVARESVYASSPAAISPAASSFSWLVAIYAVGVAIGLVRLASAFFAAALITARGVVVERRQSYRVVLSKEAPMPFAFGLQRPSVVLPAAALDWDPAVRDDVVAHEAAHVARQDWLWLLLGRIAAVLYWPNLGVAWMLHRARLDAEMAADDQVVAAGQDQIVYAEHLVRVARACQTTALLAPMAAEPPLTSRLRSLLGAGVRRNNPGRPAAHAALVLALLLVGPFAAMGFGPRVLPEVAQITDVAIPPEGAARATMSGSAIAQAAEMTTQTEVQKTGPAQQVIDVAPNAAPIRWQYPQGAARARNAPVPMPTFDPPVIEPDEATRLETPVASPGPVVNLAESPTEPGRIVEVPAPLAARN